MRIAVIGAGIGGLVFARALERRSGLGPEIFEAADHLGPVGSGMILTANAVRELDRLDLLSDLEKVAQRLKEGRYCRLTLEPLMRVPLDRLAAEMGYWSYGAHRADLQSMLLGGVDSRRLHLGKRLAGLERSGRGCRLSFADGSSYAADLVVGADGIHSVVRSALFEDARLRDSGQVAWRGVLNLEEPFLDPGMAMEAWGSGFRYGALPIGNRRWCWFAVAKTRMAIAPPAELFRRSAPWLSRWIESTPPELIQETPLKELVPLNRWVAGRVVLLGDAAHAMTPNLSQGANQAIEDAARLADLLSTEPRVEIALRSYERSRIPRVRWIAWASRTLGHLGHLESSPACAAREGAMRRVPTRLTMALLRQVYRGQGNSRDVSVENTR